MVGGVGGTRPATSLLGARRQARAGCDAHAARERATSHARGFRDVRTPVARRGVVAARAREVTSFARRFEPAGVPGKKTDARRRWLDAFRSHRRSSFLDSKKKSAERTTRPCHSTFPRDFFLPRPRETQIRDGSRRAIGRERFISAKLELKLELELPKFCQFELQFWNCELQFDLQFDLQFCAYKSHHARSLAALGGSVDCAHFENRRFRSPRRNPTAAAES